MNEKKNIDRLFQEKFKNFEVTPDDSVWEKINSKRGSKKRVLILPLWYRITGVAALVAAILLIGSFLIPNNSQQEQVVVNPSIEKVNETPTDDLLKAPDTPKELVNIPDKSNREYKKDVLQNVDIKNEVLTTNTIKTDNSTKESITPIVSAEEKTSITSLTGHNDANQQKNSVVASRSTKSQDVVTQQERILDQAQEKAGVSLNSDTHPSHTKNHNIVTNDFLFNTVENDSITIRKKKNLIAGSTLDQDFRVEDNIVERKTKTDSLQADEPVSAKTSIFDAIIEKDEVAKLAQTSSDKKWDIAPTVAPVYYNPTGNASTVDSEFSDNSKNGQINMSYGVQIAYNLNKKISIRSGVNKLDVGYNTGGIGFSATTAQKREEGIDYNTNSQNIEIFDFVNQQGSESSFDELGSRNLSTEQNLGSLNHRLGYIEVPLEMTYAFSDKKFGVRMIGGVSTLFLEDDEVSIIAGDFKTNLGEGTNVNNVSFSGNVGLGLNYKISEQFRINMEPIFKYQFNGFKETAEDFKPYYFGVYTGVSFEF
ncbi:hypothetical protein [Aquimarina addita]